MIENSPPEAKKIEMTQSSTCATAAAILYGNIIFSSNEFLFWFVRTYCTTLVKHVFSNTNGVCCWYCVRMVCTGFELWCWVHVRWAWRSVHSNGVGQCYSLRAYCWVLARWPPDMSIAKVNGFSKPMFERVLVSKWSEHKLH